MTSATEIEEKLRIAVAEHSRMRQVIGVFSDIDNPYPKYAFLGNEESRAMDEIFNRHCVFTLEARFKLGDGVARTFMGVELIEVKKPSHLSVGD